MPAPSAADAQTSNSAPDSAGAESLTENVADDIRRRLIDGGFMPGQQLPEASLCEQFDISRNTLREAFRVLTHERLLVHRPHKGVFVAIPSIAAIIDIYRVRRIIECQALAQSLPRHPAGRAMRAAVEEAQVLRATGDWLGVGTANMKFHAAIVALADSDRLTSMSAGVAAELRLAFGVLDDLEFLHAPYVDMNERIVELYEAGDPQQAASTLDAYLVQSERTVLAALARRAS